MSRSWILPGLMTPYLMIYSKSHMWRRVVVVVLGGSVVHCHFSKCFLLILRYFSEISLYYCSDIQMMAYWQIDPSGIRRNRQAHVTGVTTQMGPALFFSLWQYCIDSLPNKSYQRAIQSFQYTNNLNVKHENAPQHHICIDLPDGFAV